MILTILGVLVDSGSSCAAVIPQVKNWKISLQQLCFQDFNIPIIIPAKMSRMAQDILKEKTLLMQVITIKINKMTVIYVVSEGEVLNNGWMNDLDLRGYVV